MKCLLYTIFTYLLSDCHYSNNTTISNIEIAISAVCTAVARATEKVEEERSPSSIDSLIFHGNQLYRLLLAYSEDDQLLEEVGRNAV